MPLTEEEGLARWVIGLVPVVQALGAVDFLQNVSDTAKARDVAGKMHGAVLKR